MPIDSVVEPFASAYSPASFELEQCRKKDDPEKVAKAATDFEALLVGQLLKAAREAGGTGWMGMEDGAGSTLLDMAEQSLSSALSKQGGLGLAKMIKTGLEKKASRGISHERDS